MPLVSVIICCYNSEKYLNYTIQSVLNQTFRDFEIVIVNDGSTDSTADIVKSYIKSGNPIVYHYQENKGFGAARNKCIELATGEYIAIIDHDDLCLPQRLEQQIILAKRHQEIGFFFSNTEHFLDDGTVICCQYDKFRGMMASGNVAFEAGEAVDQLLMQGCFIDTESVMFKKEVAQTVGGFSNSYRYIVDYDFFLRVGEKFAMLGDKQVLSRWRIHPQQASQTMGETMLRENIDLLTEWSRKTAINPDARKIANLRLWESLVKYSLFLTKNGRFGDSYKYFLKAIASSADIKDCVILLLNKFFKNKISE